MLSQKGGPNRGDGRRATLHRYLPDIVYGANNGAITTLAVISGVTGAELSARVVLILGLANLFADGFSMGASNYLALRSRGEGQHLLERTIAAMHGLATFASFVSVGIIPLLAYLLLGTQGQRFTLTVLITFCSLFGIGAARSFFTRRSWWRGGMEMLFVGAAAAAVAYAVGAFLALLTSGQATLY